MMRLISSISLTEKNELYRTLVATPLRRDVAIYSGQPKIVAGKVTNL